MFIFLTSSRRMYKWLWNLLERFNLKYIEWLLFSEAPYTKNNDIDRAHSTRQSIYYVEICLKGFSENATY